MIYTSYFDKISELPDNVIPVSICGKAPDWYKGLQYKTLAPKLEFFKKWEQTKDNDYYTDNYNRLVLNVLTVEEVLEDLYNKLNDEQKGILYSTDSNIDDCKCLHIVLICYEKPEEFCHRHIVADWFNENNIIVKEWEYGGIYNG